MKCYHIKLEENSTNTTYLMNLKLIELLHLFNGLITQSDLNNMVIKITDERAEKAEIFKIEG